MKMFVLIFIFFSFTLLAKPEVPRGWAELNSLDPIILTWVKAEPEKKLVDVPTITVQSLPLSDKIKTFFKTHNREGKCFELQDKEWNQTWCEKAAAVLVILTRNETPELRAEKKKVQDWLLND